MKNFSSYLLTKTHINKKYVPYYQKWVMDCYAFLKKDTSSILSSNEKNSFLEFISKRREIWQVKQASYALQLYSFYLSQGQTKSSVDTNGLPQLWKQVEEKAKNALRLQHKSYSTEKTYIYWLRHFHSFVKHRGPQELNGTDLQNSLDLSCR